MLHGRLAHTSDFLVQLVVRLLEILRYALKTGVYQVCLQPKIIGAEPFACAYRTNTRGSA